MMLGEMVVTVSMALLALVTALSAAPALAAEPPALYKTGPGPYPVQRVDLVKLPDPARNTELKLAVTYPEAAGPFPVICWSHGAWASKAFYKPLVEQWASHGYVVIQPNHRDSVEEGGRWRDTTAFLDWAERPKDISLIIDGLDVIEALVPALKGRLDHGLVGVGGHSYGAHTAQLISGAAMAGPGGRRVSHADPRVKAAVLLSAQGRGGGLDQDSWRSMTIPVIVVTGSMDTGRGGQSWQWRKEPFEFSPPGDKYFLFIQEAWHGFGGVTGTHAGPGSGPPRADHMAWVFFATTAFWDAYLKGSAEARAHLGSNELELASQGQARITAK